MDALCLAAGLGSRFGRLGTYLQKCMYPVGLTPFVAFSVRNLIRSGAARPGRDRLTFVVGHHEEQVRAYFGSRHAGLELAYVRQGDPQGTGHAVATAWQAMGAEASVLCWLADAYVPERTFARLAAHEADTALTLAPGPEHENPSVRVDVAEGRVTRSLHGSGSRFDIGAWKLSPEVMAGMRERDEGGEIRMLANLQGMITRGLHVGYVDAEEWLHLGGTVPTPEANTLRVVDRVRALEGLDAGLVPS